MVTLKCKLNIKQVKIMPESKFHSIILPNGITVLGEEMSSVASASLSVLIPIGAATDRAGFEGATRVLGDMFYKGCRFKGSELNARELSDKFESLGIHRSHSVGTEVTVFSFAMLGENLMSAIELASSMLLLPTLPDAELDSVKSLALQDILSLDDQPSSKVMVHLTELLYPHPFGRSQLGTINGVESVSTEHLREYHKSSFVPSRSIISVAGKFCWNEFVAQVNKCFGAWQGNTLALECGSLRSENFYEHEHQDTAQLQIALGYPSVSYDHVDYYVARMGVALLSGGMAGRLFIEVREKRGLVYRVSASHGATKGRAAVFGYAGTTPERGQETLDVMLGEFRHLGEGITEDELQRAKADVKSRLVMQGELSSARASALVNDWWNLSRVRTLEEIKAAIDAVSGDDIARHTREFPASPVTLVTLGSKKLEVSNL